MNKQCMYVCSSNLPPGAKPIAVYHFLPAIPPTVLPAPPAVVQPIGQPAVVQLIGQPAVVQPIGQPAVVQPIGQPAVVQPIGQPAVVQPTVYELQFPSTNDPPVSAKYICNHVILYVRISLSAIFIFLYSFCTFKVRHYSFNLQVFIRQGDELRNFIKERQDAGDVVVICGAENCDMHVAVHTKSFLIAAHWVPLEDKVIKYGLPANTPRKMRTILDIIVN